MGSTQLSREQFRSEYEAAYGVARDAGHDHEAAKRVAWVVSVAKAEGTLDAPGPGETERRRFRALLDAAVKGARHGLSRRLHHLRGDPVVVAVRNQFVSATDLAEGPPVEWLIDGLIPVGSLCLLSAKPKVGKSTLVAAVIYCVSTGTPFAGRQAVRSPVVYVSEEGNITLRSKRGKHGWGPDVHILSREGLNGGAEPSNWEQRVQAAHLAALEVGARLIVFDTFGDLAKFRSDDENSTGQVNQRLEPLKSLTGDGLTIWLVSHAKKGDGDDIDSPKGSNALTGGVDLVASMTKPHRDGTIRTLRLWGRYDALDGGPWHLDYNKTTGQYRSCDAPDVEIATAKLDAVLDVLRSAPSGLTVTQIGKACRDAEGKVMADSSVRRRIDALSEAGQIISSGAIPKVWSLHHHPSPLGGGGSDDASRDTEEEGLKPSSSEGEATCGECGYELEETPYGLSCVQCEST